MSKVYVITQGEYSDYSTVNVLSTQELAEEFKDYYNNLVDKYGQCDIEVYELDKWIPQFRQGLSQYHVEIERDGTVRECRKIDGIDDYYPDVVLRSGAKKGYIRNSPEWSIVSKDLDKYCVPVLYIKSWAKDKEHAIKIANEKRTSLLSQGLIPDSVVDIYEFQKDHGYWNTVEEFWEWKNDTKSNAKSLEKVEV